MSCLRYLSVIIIKIYFNKKRIIIIFKFKIINIMFAADLYKENLFLIGLILNSICCGISIVLIILSGFQYRYINVYSD